MTAATHTGKVRARNEDCLRIEPHLGLAVVADGMGGHRAGDVASRMAVAALAEFYRDWAEECDDDGHIHVNVQVAARAVQIGETLCAALRHANRAVHAASAARAECAGMGTTLLAAVFARGAAHISHIGDSRLYRLKDGSLAQLTADHTLAAEMQARGETPPAHAHHILQRALGTAPDCAPDCFTRAAAPGETYLLCSDGLSGLLDSEEIAAQLAHADAPEKCADALIAECIKRGAPDNISLVLVRLLKKSPARPRSCAAR